MKKATCYKGGSRLKRLSPALTSILVLFKGKAAASTLPADISRFSPRHLKLEGSQVKGDVKDHSLMKPWRATASLNRQVCPALRILTFRRSQLNLFMRVADFLGEHDQ